MDPFTAGAAWNLSGFGSGFNSGPATSGPAGSSADGDVTVGGLTFNKKPDWPMLAGVALLTGVVVWVAVKR